MSNEPPLVFTYRNFRGEVAERRVRPISVVFGKNDWHPVPQWLLVAHDLDKDAVRNFAMRDMGPAGVIELQEAANAAAFAFRELDLWNRMTEIPHPTRVALARASLCLDAALTGRPKPTF